ncbi:hypothetical protein GWK47_017160 [Chionoecetes opilio]|uniref:Uncharacterized protein n=1 Tax=Chionoecetes opilio TaxID=41210 RepID=A0A8J4XW45_CHIOP|nr:hypothetical protein GWK47_017160 [Chionoecetes opilio]
MISLNGVWRLCMQQFNLALTKDEEQRQYLLQVVESHRSGHPDARKSSTNKNHLIFYSIVVDESRREVYEQKDPSNPTLKRESAELYSCEPIPPLIFSTTLLSALAGNHLSQSGHHWEVIPLRLGNDKERIVSVCSARLGHIFVVITPLFGYLPPSHYA